MHSITAVVSLPELDLCEYATQSLLRAEMYVCLPVKCWLLLTNCYQYWNVSTNAKPCNTKFHENSFSHPWVVSCVQTDKHSNFKWQSTRMETCLKLKRYHRYRMNRMKTVRNCNRYKHFFTFQAYSSLHIIFSCSVLWSGISKTSGIFVPKHVRTLLWKFFLRMEATRKFQNLSFLTLV